MDACLVVLRCAPPAAADAAGHACWDLRALLATLPPARAEDVPELLARFIAAAEEGSDTNDLSEELGELLVDLDTEAAEELRLSLLEVQMPNTYLPDSFRISVRSTMQPQLSSVEISIFASCKANS